MTRRALCLLLAGILLALPGCSDSASGPASGENNKTKVAELYAELKRKNFPDTPDVTPQEVMAWQARGEKVVLVDVRPEAERKPGFIPGAITEAELAARIETLKDAKIVAYCTISFRSAKNVADLRKRGFSAYNLQGGILGWTHAGGAVADATGPATRVHVYSRNWNFLPDGYEAVW